MNILYSFITFIVLYTQVVLFLLQVQTDRVPPELSCRALLRQAHRPRRGNVVDVPSRLRVRSHRNASNCIPTLISGFFHF
jgi:hypothetical protein